DPRGRTVLLTRLRKTRAWMVARLLPRTAPLKHLVPAFLLRVVSGSESSTSESRCRRAPRRVWPQSLRGPGGTLTRTTRHRAPARAPHTVRNLGLAKQSASARRCVLSAGAVLILRLLSTLADFSPLTVPTTWTRPRKHAAFWRRPESDPTTRHEACSDLVLR